VRGPIAAALSGRDFETQEQLDDALLRLDGTPNKARLGANAVLGVSLAFARATAAWRRTPLYRHFAEMIGHVPSTLPRLTVNLFSGGRHAGGQVAVQDVLLVPAAASTIDEALVDVSAVYHAAAELVREKYNMRLLTADEGGLAPPFASVGAMLDDAMAAIRAAGLSPGPQMQIAIDVAASHFFTDGAYVLDGEHMSRENLIERLCQWVETYPIASVEDGLAEDDWEGWPLLRQRLTGQSLLVGDDLLCTSPPRIERAIVVGACDTLLLKVNQVGTLTEAAAALCQARSANWRVTVSARSGETEDNWLADLAVGWGADQIKVGSITQSERLAKYNRLLAIERETHWPVVDWPGARPAARFGIVG
jgi:enolase